MGPYFSWEHKGVYELFFTSCFSIFWYLWAFGFSLSHLIGNPSLSKELEAKHMAGTSLGGWNWPKCKLCHFDQGRIRKFQKRVGGSELFEFKSKFRVTLIRGSMYQSWAHWKWMRDNVHCKCQGCVWCQNFSIFLLSFFMLLLSVTFTPTFRNTAFTWIG